MLKSPLKVLNRRIFDNNNTEMELDTNQKDKKKEKHGHKQVKKKAVARYFDTKKQNEKTEVFRFQSRKYSKQRFSAKSWDSKKPSHLHNKRDRKGHRKYGEKRLPGKHNKINPNATSLRDQKESDPYPGNVPIPKNVLMKYSRGKAMNTEKGKGYEALPKFRQKEKNIAMAVKQAARSEMLLNEEAGFMVAEEGESTADISQHEIADAVDISSAEKHFELKLPDFGPYHVEYTRNGRYLLMGGAKGHVAAIDWQTKKLLCEINVMETVNDVEWLHQETMFAVAQKQWTYIYDSQGVELHCLKMLDHVLRMEFLPFHFLLATSSAKGYLSWIDVSVGQVAGGRSTQLGRLGVLCQNPQNAVLCCGHAGGTVTMWTPNMKQAVVKMLCHKGSVMSLAVDPFGQYLATSSIDRTVKIWDLRNYKMLQSYRIGVGASSLDFSQKELLAVGKGNIVEVYKDCCRQAIESPYLTHRVTSPIAGVRFCPYEDVLGVGHTTGFESLIVPGAGEPNFDALEANPFQTKKQRKEAEVKMLLDKIPADMINITPNQIAKIDMLSAKAKIQEHRKKQLAEHKAMGLKGKFRKKKKGKGSGAKKEQRKKGMIEGKKREIVKEILKDKKEQHKNFKQDLKANSGVKKTKAKKSVQRQKEKGGGRNVLDRFKKKSS